MEQLPPSTEPPGLHAVVLAAGGSTRFGSPKQLVRVQGHALLHRAVANAVEVAGRSVTVVLGAHAAELASLLKHSSASIIVNREWAEGIGSSIRAAIARLPPSCEGVLVTLADQAAVTVDDLSRLISAWRGDPRCIVAARYDATIGVPAVFPRAYFSDLAALRGDRGARDLIRRHADRTIGIALANASIDIDIPEDLLRLPT